MQQNKIVEYFEKYLNRDSIFKDKKTLQESHTPEIIIHREEQTKQIANVLMPALKLEKPSNVFIYGKTGTGKTLTIKHIIKSMQSLSEERNIPLKFAYVNCKLKKVADTEYRIIAELARSFGKNLPPTGLPTQEIYKSFFNTIDAREQMIIIILDEIDQLVKKSGDEILYNLTRANTELRMSQMSLVGISNDLIFADGLDPRVKSSLSEEEIIFPPYNALQLQHILKRRAKKAFKASIISEGVIEKCAAYAAREHGDARRALELLRISGEIAERSGSGNVEIKHLDDAEQKIERDRVYDILMTQPKQYQATLYAILVACEKKHKGIMTGDVYGRYRKICMNCGLRPLTQRRVSDIIGELDMFGVVNAKVISRGRYGRTREISVAIPDALNTKTKKLLEDGLGL